MQGRHLPAAIRKVLDTPSPRDDPIPPGTPGYQPPTPVPDPALVGRRYAGSSGCITTSGATVAASLSSKQYSLAELRMGRVRSISFYCPDGTDPDSGTNPTLAANTHTVFVGPNGTAGWPLAPGAWKTFEDVDPGDVMIDEKGFSGQHIFFEYGGHPP